MLGERLKKIRKEKGLTLQELAELIPSSPGFISEVENGLKMPGSEFVVSLKRIFDVDLNWLLMGEDGSKPPPEPIEEKIIVMLQDMPDDQKRDVLKYAAEKKLLAELLAERGAGKRKKGRVVNGD